MMIEETPALVSAETPALYIGMDLAKKNWALALTDRSASKPTSTSVPAYNWSELKAAIGRAKKRFGLAEDAPVVCCQEAGRDGFAVHRWLETRGIIGLVIDPASIETSRRKRKAKTDKLDARKLVRKLRSYITGDEDVFSVCRVPPEEAEDARRLVRERVRLVGERTQHRTRIKSLLATIGIEAKVDSSLVALLKHARTSSDKPLGPHIRREVLRELERLELVEHQLAELQAEMREAVTNPQTPADHMAAQLLLIAGVGLITAVTLAREFFGWRRFRNRKQVGGAAGLSPTPDNTGDDTDKELGISKAGNKRVRTLMIEIAWGWLGHQPRSRQTLWYYEKLGDGTRRAKRKLIVAVARRLLIDFWRFVDQGVIPDGTRVSVS